MFLRSIIHSDLVQEVRTHNGRNTTLWMEEKEKAAVQGRAYYCLREVRGWRARSSCQESLDLQRLSAQDSSDSRSGSRLVVARFAGLLSLVTGRTTTPTGDPPCPAQRRSAPTALPSDPAETATQAGPTGQGATRQSRRRSQVWAPAPADAVRAQLLFTSR